MAVAHEKGKYTIDDYMHLPEGAPVELIGGEFFVSPAPKTTHQRVCWNLASAFDRWIREQHHATAFFAPTDVIFSRHDAVQPDMLIISRERSGIITEDNIQGAPDLIVEILSPETKKRDQRLKKDLYGRHGVKEYWLVDPPARTVEVYMLENGALTLKRTLAGSDLLNSAAFPDFSVSLPEIFEAQ